MRVETNNINRIEQTTDTLIRPERIVGNGKSTQIEEFSQMLLKEIFLKSIYPDQVEEPSAESAGIISSGWPQDISAELMREALSKEMAAKDLLGIRKIMEH